MKLDGCRALITGASAGLGREFASALAGRAKVLVLVARREERLNELRDELRRQNPQLQVHLRAVDLRERNQTDELCAWLEREQIAVDFLINNAGLGDHGLFAKGDTTRPLEIADVNIAALILLTRRLLPQMIAGKRGAILNVSSAAGFLPLSNMAVYAASKAFVTSFSEALRAELRSCGISVTALCPGPVETEFATVAKRKDSGNNLAPRFLYLSAEKVVRVGLRAVERDDAIIIPGLAFKLVAITARLLPRPLLRLALGCAVQNSAA